MKGNLKILLILFVIPFSNPLISENGKSLLMKLPSLSETVGDSPTIGISDIDASPGVIIDIPAVVSNFNNIGAVSLTLNYDPAVINYQSYVNTSGFPGLIVFSPAPGTIVVAGFNLIPDGFTIADGMPLFTMSFTYQEGSTLITWFDDGSSCEFAGPTPDYMPKNDQPTCIFYQNGSVNVSNQSLAGTVSLYSYANPAQPVDGFTIELRDDNDNTLTSTVTNGDGTYAFSTIPVETAYLYVSSPLDWSGVNATDALAIEKHSIGHQLQFWYPDEFINRVADVNNSGIHNSTDALSVLKRSIQLMSSFDAGDWIFYTNGTVFENIDPGSAKFNFNGQSQINILALCVGDVNGSAIFQTDVSLPQITFVNDIRVNPHKKFLLPVSLSSEESIGALTLSLMFDHRLIQVHEIRSSIPGLIYHIKNNCIRVVWQGQEPLNLSKDGSVFTIVAQLNSPYTARRHLFELGSETEFADPECNILQRVNVTIPGIDQSIDYKSESSNVIFSYRCFPNPCRNMLTVNYFLPLEANTNIIIRNLHGEIILNQLMGRENRGQHHHTLDLKSYGMVDGIYHLNLIAEDETAGIFSGKPKRIILITE